MLQREIITHFEQLEGKNNFKYLIFSVQSLIEQNSGEGKSPDTICLSSNMFTGWKELFRNSKIPRSER